MATTVTMQSNAGWVARAGRTRGSGALLLACTLALATGVTLFAAGRSVFFPAPALPTPGRVVDADLDLTRAFYASLNDALTTGDLDPLERLLAPDFAAHHGGAAATADRDWLVQMVQGRRAAFPDARIAIERLEPVGEASVLAFVTTTGADHAHVLGLEAGATLASWGPRDLLRLDGGKIAEWWPGGEAPLVAEDVSAASFEDVRALLGETIPLTLHVERFAVDAGERSRLPRDGAGRLLVVESGTVTIKVSPNHPNSVADHLWTTVVLAAGEAHVIDVGSAVVLSNDEAVAATVTILIVRETETRSIVSSAGVVPAQGDRHLPTGGAPPVAEIEERTIAQGVVVPTGRTLSLGWATLGPNAGVETAAGALVAVVVESGSIEALAEEGMVWSTRDSVSLIERPWAELAAGDGFFVETNDRARLRGGPHGARLLVVAIEPAEDGG